MYKNQVIPTWHGKKWFYMLKGKLLKEISILFDVLFFYKCFHPTNYVFQSPFGYCWCINFFVGLEFSQIVENLEITNWNCTMMVTSTNVIWSQVNAKHGIHTLVQVKSHNIYKFMELNGIKCWHLAPEKGKTSWVWAVPNSDQADLEKNMSSLFTTKLSISSWILSSSASTPL